MFMRSTWCRSGYYDADTALPSTDRASGALLYMDPDIDHQAPSSRCGKSVDHTLHAAFPTPTMKEHSRHQTAKLRPCSKMLLCDIPRNAEQLHSAQLGCTLDVVFGRRPWRTQQTSAARRDHASVCRRADS